MGNAQDPSAPPSPYVPDPGVQVGKVIDPVNTPGLPVPQVDPNTIGPPVPGEMLMSHKPPGEQMATADATPPPDPQQNAGTGLAPPQALQPSSAVPQPFTPSVGGFANEARARGKRDAEENAQLRRSYQGAIEEQKQAADAVSDVQRYQASDLAENMQHQQRQLAEIDARGKQSQLVHQRTIDDRQQQLDDAVNSQKNMVFDPDKYVNSMSVGQKIMTSIAVGLGAIGASRSIGGSGENIGQKMLQDSIQHGIDQQKEAYRRAGVNIDMANNAYARARQSGLDDKDATIAARLASINDHKMAADVITARYEPDKVDANRKVLQANLDAQAVKAQQEFAQSSQAAAARNAAEVLGAVQTGFNMNVAGEHLRLAEQNQQWAHDDRQSALAEKAMADQAKAAGRTGGVPAGWTGTAPVTNEQKNKAAELSGTERILTRKLGEMLKFRQDFGDEQFNRSEIAKVKSTAAQVKVALKDKFGLGVMSDADSELLDNVARDPSKVSWTPATTAQLQHLIEQIHADTDDQMEGYGLQRDQSYKPRGIIPFKEAEGAK